MFEVAGTHFQKGTFELDLERRPAGPLAWPLKLGAIRGRLLALALILLAGWLTIRNQPGRWLMFDMGLETSTARLLHSVATWSILIVGAAIYFLVIVRRQEKMKVAFDRTRGEFRFVHTPPGRHARAQEGVFPFEAIEKIEVYGPQREPVTPHGFVELLIKADRVPEAYRQTRFRLLTDEQLRFFPANIARMTGIQPAGDFKDPDDEPVGTR